VPGDDAGDDEAREARRSDLYQGRTSRSLRRPENTIGRRATDINVSSIATRKVVVVSDVVIVALYIISEAFFRSCF